MSGVSSFLQKMRKAELLELAEEVGFTDYDGMRKVEVEVALDNYLKENASTHSDNPKLEPYYRRRSESSPVKKEAVSSLLYDADSKLKSVKRRVTKVAEDFLATDESEIEQAATRSRTALTRTPRASGLSSLSFASGVPLPPSPAVVANAIDRQTVALRSKLSEYYEESGIVENTHAAREALSTVVTVQALIIAFEFYKLRQEILGDRYAFTFPAIALLGTHEHAVKIPDLFLLLTGSFWGPATLWGFTSLLIPLFAAYFVNLTSKPSRGRGHASHFNYEFDPLTFNIVKALLTFVVYGQDVTFGGLVDLESVARINSAIYGGYKGVLVGNGIGALVTIYEAVVKK